VRPQLPLARTDFGLAVAGGAYGLSLTRYLFEVFPAHLFFLNSWGGALTGALLGAFTLFTLTRRYPLREPWAVLALGLPLLNTFAPDTNLLRAQTLLTTAPVLLGLLVVQAKSQLAEARVQRLFDAGVFLILFSLYTLTLAPAVGEADTFEFQVGIARLGIAHGSGYPLVMLLGKVFTLLPLGGTLAWRANLLSAFFGAVAGVGVGRLARGLGVSPLIAFLVALLFGVAPTLWSRAVEVEAYTLNAAFVVFILYLLASLILQPSASFSPLSSRLSPVHLLVGAFFLLGLSLTNHLTTLLLFPAVGLTLLLLRQRLSPAHLFTCSLAFLLGLSIYLYIPLRWPAVNHGEFMSWAQFTNILSGNEAKGAFQWALPFQDATRYAIVFRKIIEEYGGLSLTLALVGWLALLATARTRWMGLLLGLTYVGYAYFALAFNVPDPDFSAFFIPLHLMAAVLLGLGAQAILAALNSLNTPYNALRSRPPLPTALRLPPFVTNLLPSASCLLTTTFCLLICASIWNTYPRVDQSRDWVKQRWGENALRYPLAEQAAILADSDKIAPLYYLQVAEGQRPDLDIIVLPDEDSYRAVLEERLAAGQTVYLARYLPGLGSAYSLRSVGPLAEVSPQPFRFDPTDEKSFIPLEAEFEGRIALLGYQLPSATFFGGNQISLTLYWRAPQMGTTHQLVYLRLVSLLGRVVWQSAGQVPVNGLYPTNAWRSNEIISDYYALALSPGLYQLEVGLFPPFQPAADTGWARVRSLIVTASAETPRPTHPVRAQFGGQWLMGYDAPEAAAPGSRVPVTLYWLHDAQTDSVTVWDETRSLVAWPVGQTVAQTYWLTMPMEGAHYPLTITSPTSARCGWLTPESPDCELATIQLTGAAIAEDAFNFDNQLLLTRVTLETPSVVPGGQAKLTLQWQGLRAIAENYTVFVHLIGPDGRVYGQVDLWPVSGTRATSQWVPGEVIEDRYTVPLDAEAPPGDYQVEVGLYLLATLQRLPVLNAEGQPIEDKVLVDGVRVGN